jgi:hypothetical protein
MFILGPVLAPSHLMPEKRADRDKESEGHEERGCQCCQVTGHRHLLHDCGGRGGDLAAGCLRPGNGVRSAAKRVRACLAKSARLPAHPPAAAAASCRRAYPPNRPNRLPASSVRRPASHRPAPPARKRCRSMSSALNLRRIMCAAYADSHLEIVDSRTVSQF